MWLDNSNHIYKIPFANTRVKYNSQIQSEISTFSVFFRNASFHRLKTHYRLCRLCVQALINHPEKNSTDIDNILTVSLQNVTFLRIILMCLSDKLHQFLCRIRMRNVRRITHLRRIKNMLEPPVEQFFILLILSAPESSQIAIL